MRIVKAATIAVILLLTVSGMWLYLSLRGHGFSAREKPSGIEQFLAVRVRYLAMPSRADAMRNPFAADAEAIAGGAEHFQETCAICHALDGSGKTDIGVGFTHLLRTCGCGKHNGFQTGRFSTLSKTASASPACQLGTWMTTTSGISSH